MPSLQNCRITGCKDVGVEGSRMRALGCSSKIASSDSICEGAVFRDDTTMLIVAVPFSGAWVSTAFEVSIA